MRFFLFSLLLGLATAAAAQAPADTARQAKPRPARHRHADRYRTGPEIYQGPLSRQLDLLGDSSTVAPARAPRGAGSRRSPRAQARALARERVRQGWGPSRGE